MLPVRSATVDGEAVYCGKDGISAFDKLHSHAYNDDVFLYAFDLLELNGNDLRKEPLERRKGKLEKLLVRGGWGLRFVEHMQGDGPIIFKHACKLKLEGIVSKRKDLGYRSGRSKISLKMKNPASPAALRIIEENSIW
jgi:ATP-dependent DNA ligase